MDKIEFSGDVFAQANYICFLAKSIVLGEYQKGPYYLTPKLVAGDGRTIFFPDFSYPSWFWQEIRKDKNSHYGESMSKKTIDFVLKKIEVLRTDEAIKQWQAVEKDYFSYLRKFLRLGPVLDKTKIEVLLTPFGTPGSFYSAKATSRLDLGIKNIARTVLLALYRIADGSKDYSIGETSWYARQGIIDFVMNQTSLSLIFKGEIKNGAIEDVELAQTSQEYFQKLGFPQSSMTALQTIDYLFTPQERSLLHVLQARRNQIVSFDQAGEAVWGAQTDDKFSLEALAKVVEAIRKKLILAGINKELIFTKRKQGYVLVG